MNNLLNWFTNKKIVFIGLISTIGFFILISKEVLFTICDPHNSTCTNTVGYFTLILMIGVITFIPSLVTFFIKQKVFYSWRKTLFIYSLIYLFIIIVTPWYAGDGFFHIQKDLIALFVSVCYFIFSLFFIFYQSLKKE